MAYLIRQSVQEIMQDPVLLMGDGQTYERRAIAEWLASHDTSPCTGATLAPGDARFKINYHARSAIQAFLAK